MQATNVIEGTPASSKDKVGGILDVRSSKNAISPHCNYDDQVNQSPFDRVTKSGTKYQHVAQSAEKQQENSNVKLVSEVAKLQQTNVHYPTSANKDPKSTGAVN